jgi:signal transduction histidine kinase
LLAGWAGARPVHPILGHRAVTPLDLEEARQMLAQIVQDGTRVCEIVHRILALMKEAPNRRERVDINEAIREVLALTHGETVKNGVSVQTDLAQDLPLIEGDRVQLQQVMLNLIVNVIQAMSDVGESPRALLISTEATQYDVRVGVLDTGPGLRPERLPRLFEPFYTTKPDGIGMGLSICRSIIEAHGGRLWPTGHTPQGVFFQFTIPARPCRGTEFFAPRSPTFSPNASPLGRPHRSAFSKK